SPVFFDEIHRIDSSGYLLINCRFCLGRYNSRHGGEVFNLLIFKKRLTVDILRKFYGDVYWGQ
ncbi:MAG: hypothetical protein ACRDC6_32825, partial [Shewanella sp.]